MKTIFMAFAISVIGVITGSADAQPVIGIASQSATTPGLSNATGTNENSSSSHAVNARALKDFQKTFYKIQNATWSNTVDGGYVAKFTNNSIKTVVAYNRKGVEQYTLAYYSEKSMPRDVKSNVKSLYYDYDILGAIEIDVEAQTVYLVYLQDEERTKTMRVTDDDIEEIQSFKRN